jgi:hypothetical protein
MMSVCEANDKEHFSMLAKQFAFLIALNPLRPLKFQSLEPPFPFLVTFSSPLTTRKGFKEIEFLAKIKPGVKLSAVFIQNR